VQVALEKTELFDKIPQKRLYQRVAGVIQDMVLTGKLQVGDRLPSEAQLCDQLGVSRTVVREATKSLVARGLLESAPGKGTFVSAMSTQDMSDSLSLFMTSSDISARDVSDIREPLEIKIAELAAKRATEDDLAKMERALVEMDRSSDSLEDYIAADFEFHLALAEATQNELFAAFTMSLVDELKNVRRMAASVRAEYQESQEDHRAIYGMVKQHDGKGAAEAMRRHLEGLTARALIAAEKGIVGCADVTNDSLMR